MEQNKQHTKKTEIKGTWMSIISAVCWGLVANAGEFLVGTKQMDAIQITSLRLMIAGGIFLTASGIK